MIYFIRSGQYVKIGVSARPWERLADLQTAHHEPLEMMAIMPGAYDEERQLHRRFSEYHQLREWFCDNAELRALVQEIRQANPDLQSAPKPPRPENIMAIEPQRYDHESVEKACSFLDLFRQCGGVVEVYEFPDKYIIGLPNTAYEPGHDPTKLYTVLYDDGQITPKIGREMKSRTLTNRLNSAMMAVSYFIKPPLYQREGYGLFLRFDKPIPAPEPTAA